MTSHTSFAPLVERYFTQRLITQKQASPHTIASYRHIAIRSGSFFYSHASEPARHHPTWRSRILMWI